MKIPLRNPSSCLDKPFTIMMWGGGGGGGVKVSTKWRKYWITYVNKHVLMFLYKKTTSKGSIIKAH